MARKTQFVKLTKPVYIAGSAAVGTAKEREGPLGAYFDIAEDDVKFGTKTFESGESEMQRVALSMALKKANLHPKMLEAVLAGDLLNQCTGSVFGLMEYDLPFVGLFGACSTAAQSLAVGSVFIESGHFAKLGAVTSSHFCSAERQFRFPLEYGGQRSPTSQWTVTGSGAFVLCDCDINAVQPPYISEVMFGRIVDKGIDDAANMGAAMAPAAADTLLTYFRETGYAPAGFDLIVTGDLGAEGRRITENLLITEGLYLGEKYNDCGLMIYDLELQDVHAGGSGCGCSASVLAGFILRKLALREYRNVLFVGTGALMSPGSVMQGNSIPGIAHLVRLQS